jgi:hypothetical protein
MKKWTVPLAVIAVMSMAVWLLLWWQIPETPPTSGETTVIVGVCAAVVFGAWLIWKKLRK